MRFKVGLCGCVLLLMVVGCRPGGVFLKPDQQTIIDRSVVDYPPDFDLKLYAQNLTGPSGFCFDQDGTMFIAEGGVGDTSPHIFGKRADDSIIEIYPHGTRVPFIQKQFKIYGPIGGICASNGKVFVSHRDAEGYGVITAFNYDGSHSTVTYGFPTQGEFGMTDRAINPNDNRLYFGVGAATNSGVVGIDDWTIGWLRKHPQVCDVSPVDLKLYGLKFYSKNPLAGLFSGSDISVTAPLQPFGVSDRTRIKKAVDNKANSAIYSVSQSGGDLQLVCYGIRMPRGIRFNEFRGYATINGMEFRGTRPIKDDPDAMVRILPNSGTWYGWPDYSTDMTPISDDRFQPQSQQEKFLVLKGGYPDTNQLIDKENSNLPGKLSPPTRDALLFGVFQPLAGASKFDFIPSSSNVAPYRKFRSHAIVALAGDRAPFATSGLPLVGPIGYKVVDVNIDDRKVSDFVFNTRGGPASKLGRNVIGLERPCDVKMGPDGSLYILDMGSFDMKDGKERVKSRTGKIFKLEPIVEPERPK
jgi:glucose/arabinose dehydrogenase